MSSFFTDFPVDPGDLESVARRIAAKRMGLVDDALGLGVSAEAWGACEEQARNLLEVYSKDQAIDIVDVVIQPEAGA